MSKLQNLLFNIALTLILSFNIAALIAASLFHTVDNRDYPDDGFEMYIGEYHVGYVYEDDFTISITGR